MKRGWWITISLVAGLGGGTGLYLGLPEARDWLPTIFSLTSGSIADGVPYAVSLVASAGILLSAFLFLVPAAIHDATRTSDTLAIINAALNPKGGQRKKLTRSAFMAFFAGSTIMEQMAENYSSALVYASNATEPPANAAITGSRRAAASAFGPDPMVGQALYVWLYRGMAHWNIGLTVVLALVAVMRAPGTIGGDGSAILTLATGLTASLLLLGLTGLTGQLRARQTDQLCAAIDELVGHTPWHDELSEIRQISRSLNSEVAAAVSKSLKKPLDAIAGKQSDGVERLTASVLKSVKAELQEPLRQQATEMRRSIKEIGAIVAGLDREFRAAIESLAAQLAEHEKGLVSGIDRATKSMSSAGKQRTEAFAKEISGFSAALEKSAKAHEKALRRLASENLDPLSKTIANSRKHADKQYMDAAAKLDKMGRSITNLIAEISPSLARIAEGQDAFLATIEKEATAAQIIKQSSADLNAAAHASKETVQQFVALAENLTEIGRVLQKSVAQVGTSGKAAASGTGEELSDAIRKLKKMTEERSLPKL